MSDLAANDPPRRTGDRQHDAYVSRWKSATNRNRGPKGQGLVGARPVTRYFVVVDSPAPAGATCQGRVCPPGTLLMGVPVFPAFHSCRQARKALARLRKNRADAYGVAIQGRRGHDLGPTTVKFPPGVHWSDLPHVSSSVTTPETGASHE